MTLKVIDILIAAVDPKRATVASFPEFVAVFGGELSSRIGRSKAASKPKSQRDAFVQWISTNRPALKEMLIHPESYDDWRDFDTYSDLLLFETDLGYLTSAVVVFLEGAGAIAELGAFSQIASLSERLLVVVDREDHPKNSFISLGPIRSIEATKGHLNAVCVIPTRPLANFITHIPAVISALDIKSRRKHDSERLDPKNPQHQILLILDLINLFLAIQIGELQTLATHFGLNLEGRRLDKILFVLEKVELITRERYGNNQYFVPHKFRKKYVSYTAKSGSPRFNRDKIKTEAWSEVQSDQFRRIAYDLASKKGASK